MPSNCYYVLLAASGLIFIIYTISISNKLLFFGNGINFALIYLISDRGAKSDACFGFEPVSANIDLGNSQINNECPFDVLILLKTACRQFHMLLILF